MFLVMMVQRRWTRSCAGDIIESLHQLQSLKVDETKDKDKQKSEAKNIVHRRRKALTDLFKALELIGVLLPVLLFLIGLLN